MNALVTPIRPGILVSLQTSVRGNTRYSKRTIEGKHTGEFGEELESWQTTRIVSDPAEQQRASEVRNKARYMVARICATSTFGLICPEDRADELAEAIAEARELAADFNRESVYTRVGVHVLSGRIARDDVEAVEAIASEVRDLMRDMEAGIAELDVKAVRVAADKARNLGQILTADARQQVEFAVQTARSAARRIVKAGETVAAEIDRAAIATISQARTQFLDWDDEGSVARPEFDGRAIDLESLALDTAEVA